MDFVCKNKRSSPFPEDRIHFGPNYYPEGEAFPAQMHTNPPRPSINYGYFPWGNNYGCGYASPAVCHGCCNHNHWPINHAWGSSYSHVPPFHCYGGYSVPPVPYMPQPFYAMEQPQYEYEKNGQQDHHFCGCANHTSHQKEHKNVRIEEEEREEERGKNDHVVPLKFKNKPYPIVWLPSDFSMNKDNGKPESIEDSGYGSHEMKPNNKAFEQQPNGWYPLDLNNLVSSKQMGDDDKNHHPQDERKRNVPFPLFWIPYKPEEQEAGGKGNEEHKVSDTDMKLKLESEKGSGGEKNFYKKGENVDGQAARRAKDIPVKEVEEKTNTKGKVRESDAPVRDGTGNGKKKLDKGEEKLPKDGTKRESSPPPKSPKWRPVCLRVDPLPRKKNANGSSLSSSPPGDKQKVDKPSKEASKVPSDDTKPDKAGKNIVKTIDVIDGNAPEGDVNVEMHPNNPVHSRAHVSRNQQEESNSQKHVETDDAVAEGRLEVSEPARGRNKDVVNCKETIVDEAKSLSKRKLSKEEAAVIIQSAYRGFEIRKWESKKKLKEIAKVREQIVEVKQLIQAMEASPDMQDNSTQGNIIAETIMTLLLKLDMIQGLHSSIREVRKSLVRELTCLQEKLDSLMNKRSQASPGEKSIMGCDVDALKETEDVKPPHSDNGNVPGLLEADVENRLDGGSNHAKVETEDANPTVERVTENVRGDGVGVVKQMDSSTAKEDHKDLELEQCSEIALSPNYLEDAADSSSTDWGELPTGVLDDLDAQESTNKRAVEEDTRGPDMPEQVKEEVMEALITDTLSDVTDKGLLELHELGDLPLSGDNVMQETNESLENCLLDDKYESTSQQPDEKEVSISSEEKLETNQQVEMCGPFVQECDLKQGSSLNSESADAYEAAEGKFGEGNIQKQNIGGEEIEVKEIAEDKQGQNLISQATEEGNEVEGEGQDKFGDQQQILSIQSQECEGELLKEHDEAQIFKNEEMSVTLKERNKKLLEENERLRDMMEKLIKSGQEHLAAISCLSGRVNDLEKKLSRKKKLKMKPYRAPKSGCSFTNSHK